MKANISRFKPLFKILLKLSETKDSLLLNKRNVLESICLINNVLKNFRKIKTKTLNHKWLKKSKDMFMSLVKNALFI